MSDYESLRDSPLADRNGSVSRLKSRSRSPLYRSSRSRSPSRGRSRSRSDDRRYDSQPYSRRRSYSRSCSRSPYSRRHRSRSRSPMSNRRRHMGSRDNPSASRCLGVFGLSLYTEERDLRDIFSRYGPMDDCNIIYDHGSGRSRGFAFITFRDVEDAEEAKEKCSGIEVDGRRIRVDYSITQRAHTPTPGVYMGQSNRHTRRSPSPSYRRRGYSRSRSRSYSPRRY
ncbi:PREDICTED: transformer-2 protein homolog alpha-like [Priapulus caudatus]|uniref:Transformer-2 protein homolog alpha-like n=1 Tax=Priapulus caudatus TaxID=37621 RepID=A0ABM1EAN5_PRICU|nr:PREDICTED: transformer-2 protein homolog alpha-like [Priapulus caudatus]